MVSKLRRVYHIALQRQFRTLFRRQRQTMIALRVCAPPPSKGSPKTDSFWAIDFRGHPGRVVDL
jgi:hypothetical protein